MKYARSFFLGTTLVIFVAALSIIVFFFSKGTCPTGSFSCDNGTKCIRQNAFCDGHSDCIDEIDESINECNLMSGGKVMLNEMFDLRNWNKFLPEGAFDNCSLSDAEYPSECWCEEWAKVHCSSLGLTQVAKVPLADKLLLSNNSIRLDVDSFEGLHNLKLLDLAWNGMESIPAGVFREMKKLDMIILSHNRLTSLEPSSLEGLINLKWCFVSDNLLTSVRIPPLPNLRWLKLSRNLLTLDKPGDSFPNLPLIFELLLDGNRIEVLREDLFANLEHLDLLDLHNNSIRTIAPKAFDNLIYLRTLDLSQNCLLELPTELFYPLETMFELNLGNNALHVTRDMFSESTALAKVRLVGIEMGNSEFSALEHLPSLAYVEFDKFEYCSLVPKVKRCVPNTDGVSNLKDLLSKPALRISVWGVAFVTIAGNLLVLWGRGVSRDENRALSLLIRNLGVADMLMGVYLLVIGIQDVRFRGVYHQHSHGWITSWGCIAIGAIAMTSSEVSILILVFMSVERFLLIANPLGGYARLSVHAARRSMIIIWCIGLTLAILPIINWRNSNKFYGSASGMCFPLHLREKFPLGWQYSTFIFLGVNFIGLLIIATVYFGMFISVWRTRRAAPPSTADCEFAIRFFFIVLTDACCWAPVICLKILNFFGIAISVDTYAWLVVFIIPLNSAINPVLYTFTTPKYRDTFFFGCSQRSTNRSYTGDTESSRTSSNKNIMNLKSSHPEGLKSQFIISDPITNNLNSTYSLNFKL